MEPLSPRHRGMRSAAQRGEKEKTTTPNPNVLKVFQTYSSVTTWSPSRCLCLSRVFLAEHPKSHPWGGFWTWRGGVPALWGWQEAGAAQMSLHEPRFVPSHPRRERPPRCRARHGAGHNRDQHLSPLLCSLLFSYSTTQIWEWALAPLHQSLATTKLAPSGSFGGGGSSCKRGAPSAQTAGTHCTDWWEQPQLVPRVPKPSPSPHLPFACL